MPTTDRLTFASADAMTPQARRRLRSLEAEQSVVMIPDGTCTLHANGVVTFTSSDQHACRAFMSANGLNCGASSSTYGGDTHNGVVRYGRIPCRTNECWTATIWPREMGPLEPTVS